MIARGIALVCLLAAASAPALTAGGDAGADTADAGEAGSAGTTDLFDRAGAQRLAGKALAKIKEGSWGEAAELLRVAHDKDAKNAAIATDLGYTLTHLGVREEAERLFRQAIELDPRRFYAYVNLAELWSTDPMRWQRRDEMVALLEKGLETLAGDAKASANIELKLAELQRSLGRAADARARLQRLGRATVPVQVRQRATRLMDEVDAEARARALEDWPAPAVAREDRDRLAKAHVMADERGALEILDALVARWPAWHEARWERARVLERLGQLDDASAELTIVVQLAPTHALAWRHLGQILALHGGRFEAERADEALRQALALEPSWADLRELRNQVAAKRTRGGHKSEGESVPEPTAKARQLVEDAQSWIGMEAPELAAPLLRQALAESPGLVEAAVALYNLERAVPATAVKALWNDGAALWRLATQVTGLHTREAAALARPWIDRAVELGVQEARFARASLRAAAGDRTGALEDLRNYVAAEPSPPRLEEARALRVTLGTATVADSPERLVHLRLAADKPAEALAALGGSCAVGLPVDNLLALGHVYEYMGDARRALACYQIAISGRAQVSAAQMQRAWERLGATAAALPARELERLRPSLQEAARAGVALASLALARLDEAHALWSDAEWELRVFFKGASADEPRLAEAREIQQRVRAAMEQERVEQKQRVRRGLALAGGVALILLVLAFRRWARRFSLRRALRTQPPLFPALSQAIGKVRHDVIKHRASALELLSDPTTNREDVVRALLEPMPASCEVTGIFEQMVQEARALGVHLRPLGREPVFGPLVRDLAHVEELLGRNDPRHDAELRLLDQRLRGPHADGLQRLLHSGPRTRLDAGLLARWIDGVASEPGRPAWVAPGLFLQEAQIAFPMNESTLRSIFSNLLRNAVDAVAQQPSGSVQVRVEQGRDGTGGRTVSLMIVDSSPRALREEDIEARAADRGLGIVRETARRWGGHIFARPEPAPFSKAVGVQFSAPPEEFP